MGAGPKQFENSRVYLQWLNFRGAWPMTPDKKAIRWLWGTAIFLLIFAITGMIWFSSMGLSVILYTPPALELFLGICLYSIGFFALVLPVIYILIDLLVHVPRAIHDDTTSSMLPAIMVTPVTTRSILKDLTTWAFRLNMRHIAPSLMVATLFIIYPLYNVITSGNIYEIYEDIIPNLVLPLIAVAALWHFLLITGLATAACPRWFWSTGSSLFFWVVPVLSTVLLATYMLMFLLNRMEPHTFPRELVLGGQRINFESWIVVPAAAIMLEIPTMLLARYLPRLMSRRRAGEWQ